MTKAQPKHHLRRGFLGIAFALASGLAFFGGSSVAAQRSSAGTIAAAAPPTGVIAFEAKNGLYTVAAAGGEARLIAGSKPGDGDPRWSPDGTMLAFDRATPDDDNRDIFVMNADGSGVRRLTSSPALDNWPQWAPSGRSLVFVSERDDARAVYAVNVRKGGARRVTIGRFPSWTLDGRIVFTGNAAERGKIFTVKPYGADRNPLPTQPGDAVGVRVSDDGTRIAFTRHTSTYAVYTANITGADARPLVTPTNGDANDPAWSPDGGWVVYDLGPPGTTADSGTIYRSDVYIIHPDGTGNTRITTTCACCADWRGPIESDSNAR